MQTDKGEEGFDRVDGHAGAAARRWCCSETDDGELLALRQGSRTMPLIYSHLIPATLGGRARMNIANALAAAGRGVGRGRAPPRHPPGPADVQHLVLPGAGPPQRGRRAGLQGDHRLLPQRGRHAPADGVRGPDHERRRRSRTTGRRGSAPRGKRHGARARTGGDRRHRHPGRPARRGPARIRRASPRARSTRSSSARTSNLRGRKPGETAANVLEGIRRAQAEGARVQKAEVDPRRARGGRRRHATGASRATSWSSAPTIRPRSIGRRWRSTAAASPAWPSRRPGSCSSPRADCVPEALPARSCMNRLQLRDRLPCVRSPEHPTVPSFCMDAEPG